MGFVDPESLPLGRDEHGAHDLGCDPPEGDPRAVRTCGDSAGDRLAVDVAELLHREPIVCKEFRDTMQVPLAAVIG